MKISITINDLSLDEFQKIQKVLNGMNEEMPSVNVVENNVTSVQPIKVSKKRGRPRKNQNVNINNQETLIETPDIRRESTKRRKCNHRIKRGHPTHPYTMYDDINLAKAECHKRNISEKYIYTVRPTNSKKYKPSFFIDMKEGFKEERVRCARSQYVAEWNATHKIKMPYYISNHVSVKRVYMLVN